MNNSDMPDSGAANLHKLLRALMRLIKSLIPVNEAGEQIHFLRVLRWSGTLRDSISGSVLRRFIRRLRGTPTWPVVSGIYAVGHMDGAVAVCTLTSNELYKPLAQVNGVAISGRLHTVNLGIERIVRNVTANSAIRFLLMCGRESPVFEPAQALRALFENGLDGRHRIIGARGHLPVLSGVPLAMVRQLTRQVELIDCTGESDTAVLSMRISELAGRNLGKFEAVLEPREVDREANAEFMPLRPGGRREPIGYDPKGYFVITADHVQRQIVVRHYLPDNTPAHEMRGRIAQSIILGLIRENLISQMSHTGYLGAELAKAEAALRLDLCYEQDQPLRRKRS